MGVACPAIQEELKGCEGKSFNAKQELGWLREWLGCVRSEVDAGLLRVDAVLEILDQAGPGQEDGPVWSSKPKRKNKNKKKKTSGHKRGVGSGLGPIVVKAIMKPKAYVSFGVGPLVGLGKLTGPIKSPEDTTGGCKEQKNGTLAGLGQVEKPIASLVTPGLWVPSAFGESSPDISEKLPEMPSEQGTGDGEEDSLDRSVEESRRNCSEGNQKTPMGWSIEPDPLRKSGVVPARGSRSFVDDMGVLNRPNGLWVAGRTGFGPVGTRNGMSLNVIAAHSKEGEIASSSEAAVQEDGISATEKNAETDIVEVGETDSVEVVMEHETNSGMEVYRRRAGSLQGHSKGTANSNGVVLIMGDIPSKGGLVDENIVEGDMEETPVVVCRSAEREESPVSKNLKMAVEVSNITGLSCDGQEGLKVECLKRIVVEKLVTGGGKVNSNVQQEEDSNLREWGNCSDHEA